MLICWDTAMLYVCLFEGYSKTAISTKLAGMLANHSRHNLTYVHMYIKDKNKNLKVQEREK